MTVPRDAGQAGGTGEVIRSRDNALVKELRRLARGASGAREHGRVWLEGEHLCQAARARGLPVALALFAESRAASLHAEWSQGATRSVVIAEALWEGISPLESPAPMAYVLDLPAPAAVLPQANTVVLDRLQDAGNIGSILRSASAFGVAQVLALTGSAGLWSPKVLRAGMGAHFALRLFERAEETLEALRLPLVVTSSHRGEVLHQVRLPDPCAWVFGNEGGGVTPALAARAALEVRIAQPGGEESLNVAAAAAICLHASAASALGR
ncbi:MAG: RNA methyltransferase [Variovorax sp.]